MGVGLVVWWLVFVWFWGVVLLGFFQLKNKTKIWDFLGF